MACLKLESYWGKSLIFLKRSVLHLNDDHALELRKL
jgi:hypothetical protein